MMLFWYHDDKRCMWEFRNEDRSRVVAAVCDEVAWEAREEPARSGLQNFLVSHGLNALPDRAFE
jgi:hypothetical protein